MKIEIAENCPFKDVFENNLPNIAQVFDDILNGIELKTLTRLIIADTDPKNYYETLVFYAKSLNTQVVPEESEAYHTTGKCISGFDSDNIFKQYIILKSAIINILLSDYDVLYNQKNNDINDILEYQWLGITMVLHEFGHAIDNENMYFRYNFLNEERGYDLSKRSEIERYFLDGAISLWGEFYAESFVYLRLPELRKLTTPKINEFLDCVVNYTSENISECDRAFRIIYWFVHTIAELGYGNFDYSMLDDHSVYITYLQVVEKEMFRLLAKFPDTDPNNDYNRLKIVFNRLCNIGYT